MNKATISFLGLFIAITSLNAQTNVNLGAGYFGKQVTYPGLVVEAEIEHMFSQYASLPVRLDVGFCVQPRHSTTVFMDLNAGFRRYFNSGLFLEESVGVGVMESILNSDAVYQVDESGEVSETGRTNPIEFMPSLTLGIGYNLTQGTGKQNLIWVRPKLYWQVPHKTVSTYSFALQVGFTHTIKRKE